MMAKDEDEEWQAHVEAISLRKNDHREIGRNMKRNPIVASKITNENVKNPTNTTKLGNDLAQQINDDELKEINNALNSQGVKHKIFRKDKEESTLSQIDPNPTWISDLNKVTSANIGQIGYTNAQTLEWTNFQFNNNITYLRKLRGRIWKAQTKYRNGRATYLAKSNNIGGLVQKIKPIKKDAPRASCMIWDADKGAMRFCRSLQERLDATEILHGGWMDNSRAEVTCAFASLREETGLGVRGVDLHPNVIITERYLPKLVHGGENLPKKIKRRIVQAHGKHMARLFEAPENPHKELFYPFYSINSTGRFKNEDYLRKEYLNALITIPGKARYDGFQMAVIGLFPKIWRTTLYKLIKIMLIMRFVPDRIKRISRYPIPKPNKANETRPIRLCHDVYCFINYIIAELSSAAIEQCNILEEGIAAYRKGSGSANLVQAEISMREDVTQSGHPAMQLDEDEEKYFDRIPLVISLPSMKTNGFPDQGYIEMKANCMGGNKVVEIFTDIGMIESRFRCGLEQGNPDSPKIANLVIKNKHDAWKWGHLSGCINNNEEDGYIFNWVDPRDGEIKLTSFGFCDDNTKFITSLDKQAIIDRTQEHVDTTGDLSIVTTIGRKGDKCEIVFFNYNLEDLSMIKPIYSVAWSFSKDMPELKEIPIRVLLADTALNRENRNAPRYGKYSHLLDNTPHKHLGVSLTMEGKTDKTGKYSIKKIKQRMNELKIEHLDDLPQKLCVNMLLNTMHSYAPLHADFEENDLIECDRMLVNKVRKNRGIGPSDSRHHLFLSKKLGGSELRTFSDTHTIALTREIKIISNSTAIDRKTLRARIFGGKEKLATINDKDARINQNHAFRTIHKLAGLGLFIRDRDNGLSNYVIEDILAKKKYIQ